MIIRPSNARPGDIVTTPQFGAQVVALVDVWPSGIVRITFVGGLVLNTPDTAIEVRREGSHEATHA